MEDEGLFWVAVFLVALIVGASFSWMLCSWQANHECLQHGWPGSKTSIVLEQYCIRREYGNRHVVRPLDWVKEHCDEWGECVE
jgi:hypothetical protein